MSAHDFTVPEARGHSTSAEPNDVRADLSLCQEVVLADALGGSLGDVPLIAPAGLGWLWCRLLLNPHKSIPAKEWGRLLRLTVNLAHVHEYARASLRRDGLSGQLASRGKQDVMAAALRVEGAVQLRLWELGGPGATTGLREARYLHNLQEAAHAAVVAVTGQRKEAKAIQRKAAGERDALTVCVGKRLRRLPEDVLVKHAPDLLEHYGENIVPLGHGDGCGVIILDPLLERRPKMYCEQCRKQTGNTMNSGKAKNARRRLIDARKRPSRKRFG